MPRDLDDAEEAASKAREEKQKAEEKLGGKLPDGGQRAPW
jgi:hypothetical protein